jgi:hypothetical protein
VEAVAKRRRVVKKDRERGRRRDKEWKRLVSKTTLSPILPLSHSLRLPYP